MNQETCLTFAERRFAWLGEALPEPKISFEFFPPKDEAAEARFWPAVERLAELRPAYVSVTCGAGGNPAEGTAEVVERLREDFGLTAAAHLTCATAPLARVEAIAKDYWQGGVRQLVALRGDRPKDQPLPEEGHYGFAVELVRALRGIADFDISVAAYPEAHPEAASPAADLDNLRRKVEAGAARAITQYCFETDTILRFRDTLARQDIKVALAVGVLPVHNFKQVQRFSQACGASIPAWLGELYEGLDDDPEQRALIGASVAAEQARRLLVEGVEELHFYTLNRADLTIAACRMLGRKPGLARAA